MTITYPSRTYWLRAVAIFFGMLTLCWLALATSDGTLKAEDSPWFKPAKLAATMAAFSWCLGAYLSYLPFYQQRLTASVLAALALLTSGGVFVWMVARQVLLDAELPPIIYDHTGLMLYYVNKGAVMLLLAVVAYLLWQLNRTDRRKLSLPYLFGIRSGLALFLASGLMGLLVGRGTQGPYPPYTYGFEGFPFFNWRVLDLKLRGIYLLASHAIIYLPIVGNLLGRIQDHKYVPMSTGFIAVLSIMLLILLAVGWVAQVTGRAVI